MISIFQNDYDKENFHFIPNGKNSSEYSMVFQSGCGFFELSGPSFVYISSYQNPHIEKVVISNDHEYIEFIFEYSEIFCTSYTIQLIAGKVPSNIMDLIYPPVLKSIDSIPTNKNGTIIINGERLTSNSSMIIAEVKLGNCPCSIITLSPNNLTLTLNIDGITSQNNLFFHYDSTLFSSYSISNGVLTIYGQCLGKVGSVTIFNDEIPIKLQNLQINDNETVMSFTIPETMPYINILVKFYKKQSNSYFIGLSFISKFVTQPIVNCSNCIVKLFNSSYDENIENPVLSIYSDFGDKYKSNGTNIGKFSNDLDYSFFIGPGCGKKSYKIAYDNKSYQSTFNYKNPIIESCYTKDEFIICIGEFNNIGFYNNTIEPNFTSGEIRIGCCGPFELTIQPTIKGAVSKPFDIDGSTVFSCDVKCKADDYFCPHYEQCIASSMNQSINFNITFNGPTINNSITISNYQKDNWVLTLFGFDFYPERTSILIDEIGCSIANDTFLNFFLPKINSTFEINLIANQKVYSSMYNLILQNISGTTQYVYLNNSNTTSEKESSTIDWKTTVYSIAIVIFTPLGFFSIFKFFKIPERYRTEIRWDEIIEHVNTNYSSKGDEYLLKREVYGEQRTVFLDMFDNIIMSESNNNNNDVVCSSNN
ncbi:hypothetical protein ACTFIY_004849 [Dictyostelium cf. discoideum]